MKVFYQNQAFFMKKKKRSKVVNVLHLCYVKDRNFLTPLGKNGIGIFGKHDILQMKSN